RRFADPSGYAARVLYGTRVPEIPRLPFAVRHTSLDSVLYGAGATLLAAGAAAAGLRGRRANPLLARPATVLKAIHSGVVGDYLLWLVIGTAVVGGVWSITLR